MKAIITRVEFDEKPHYNRFNRYQRPIGRPKPVVFLWTEKYNPIVDMLTGERYNKPHVELKAQVAARLAEAGITYDAMIWNVKAGCSMCPCSPGWVLRGTTFQGRVDVHYGYVPSVTPTEAPEPKFSAVFDVVKGALRTNRRSGEINGTAKGG